MEKDMIYKRLADVREDSDYKQKDIAAILDVKHQTVSRWEHGVGIIPLKRLNTICNITESTMDYVAGLTQIKKDPVVLEEISKEISGKRLREFRKNINFSQKKLANWLGTTQSSISAYEAGKNLMLSAYAYQIAEKYDISIDWLCGRSNEKWIQKDLTKK